MRVAIALSGHARTWNICKDHIVDTFERYYGVGNLDWYIALWDTATISAEEIVAFLTSRKQNIIFIEMIKKNSINYFFESRVSSTISLRNPKKCVYGPNFFRSLLMSKKREHEFTTGVIYKVVIFARPDVMYYTSNLTSVAIPNLPTEDWQRTHWQNFEFQTMKMEPPSIPFDGLSATDLFIIAGTFASDLIGMIYPDLNNDNGMIQDMPWRQEDMHTVLSHFLRRHVISPYLPFQKDTNAGICGVIVRPDVDLEKLKNDIRETKESFDISQRFLWLSIDQEDTNKMWCSSERESIENIRIRKNACMKLKIDFADYEIL